MWDWVKSGVGLGVVCGRMSVGLGVQCGIFNFWDCH